MAVKRAPKNTAADDAFLRRLRRHHDELRWLYMELYDNADMFGELVSQLRSFYDERPSALRALDAKREAAGAWYRSRDMLGMQMYVDNFAGDLKGVEGRLDYLERVGVNYVHLMPFLDTPADKSRSDGGYAVRDFRSVRPDRRRGGGQTFSLYYIYIRKGKRRAQRRACAASGVENGARQAGRRAEGGALFRAVIIQLSTISSKLFGCIRGMMDKNHETRPPPRTEPV